jgi:hypothetical protein
MELTSMNSSPKIATVLLVGAERAAPVGHPDDSFDHLPIAESHDRIGDGALVGRPDGRRLA